MAFFLNQVDENLVEVPFDWQSLKLADRVAGGSKFKSVGNSKPVTISVLLCDSYQEANEIAKANAFPYVPTARWSLNGNLLYVVESPDEKKVSSILSLFAGKE